MLAASAGMSLPIPAKPNGSPADWVLANDLPEIAAQAALTTFDLTINRMGLPTNCTIIVASGSNQLDTSVCAALMKRARFKPARGVDGAPIAFAYRDRVLWRPKAEGSNSWHKDPDVVVSTPTIAKQLSGVTEVVVDTNIASIASKCYILKSVGNANLDELACKIAIEPTVSPPIIDQAKPIHGIRLLRIAFKPDTVIRAEVR